LYRYRDVCADFQTWVILKKPFVWTDISVETLNVRIAVLGGDAVVVNISKEPVALFFKGSRLRKATLCFETSGIT